jgi:ankyrin repeat protein
MGTWKRCAICWSKGADTNLQDKLGRTALILAASENQEAIVKLLLENGADRSLANSSGRTAKDIAESEGFSSIVTLLQAP